MEEEGGRRRRSLGEVSREFGAGGGAFPRSRERGRLSVPSRAAAGWWVRDGDGPGDGGGGGGRSGRSSSPAAGSGG